MKLIDLNPKFYGHGGEGISDAKTGKPIPRRNRVGISFDCPCGQCGERCYLSFENPIDGGEKIGNVTWYRVGETFENMTLTPSIQRMGKCRWHGFLTNGEFRVA